MKIDVDATSRAPIYLQIVEAVQKMVALGRLRPGDQLPTVRQLAVDLRVNPNTVARAYLELEHKGVISSQQGRGTYISAQPDAAALARQRADKLRGMVRTFLLDALSQGYTVADVQAALEQEGKRWLGDHDGSP